MNLVHNLASKAYKKDVLDILTFVSHERFEPNLCLTGHNFWSLSKFEDCDCRIWQSKYSKIPDNYHILYDGEIPGHIDFDLIITHNPFVHIPIASKLKSQYQIPIINIMHTMPGGVWERQHYERSKSLFDQCDRHVFISEYNKQAWLFTDGDVVDHGIDYSFFKPNQPKTHGVLSVANDFINRDWALGFSLWNKIKDTTFCTVVGNTPTLSEPAKNTNELLTYYQNSLIYLNTSLQSPIPMSVLEAMSCGCCVVSTNTCMLPDIITHGKTGFLYNPNKPNKFIDKIQELLQNPYQAQKIGNNARRHIIEKYNLTKFTDHWHEIINSTIN